MVQAKVTVEEPSVTSEIEKIPIKIIASQGSPGEPGAKGEDGFSPTVETSKSGRTTTITITDVNGTHTATILDGADGTGSGDMSKSTYDKNNSGVVDDAEKVNSHTVDDDVPSGFFTGAAENTYEGTSVVLTDGIALKSVELKGDTNQDGTPTPDSPVNVQVVTGEQTVTVNGKNLFLVPETETKNGVTLTKNSDGTFNLVGTATSSATFSIKLDTVLESGTYTLSKSEGNFIAVVQDYSGTSWLSQLITLNYNSDSATSSINPVGNRTAFVIQARNGITYNLHNVQVQLEKGSNVTQFVDYKTPQTYPISLGSTELCKIGDYQDYIYKSGDDWYLHKEVGKAELGSLTWQTTGTNQTGIYRMQSNGLSGLFVPPSSISVAVTGLSSHFTAVPANSAGTYGANEGLSAQPAGNYIQIYNEDYNTSTSAADLKTWLTNNNVTFYYALATPTDTKITNSTLAGQLEALAAATIYTNGTMASSGTLPAIISAETLLQTRSGMVEAIANAGTTYTAGTGISITNGVISCTFADGDTEEY